MFNQARQAFLGLRQDLRLFEASLLLRGLATLLGHLGKGREPGKQNLEQIHRLGGWSDS